MSLVSKEDQAIAQAFIDSVKRRFGDFHEVVLHHQGGFTVHPDVYVGNLLREITRLKAENATLRDERDYISQRIDQLYQEVTRTPR